MKLQCDQCGTKYAIRDDKVRGRDRVFKIRCKSCNSIITIHGVEADGATRAPDAPETPEWYYAKDGQQVGPVTRSAMHDAVRAGSIKADTYVWRKEMDGWAAASEVPLLADMLSTDESAIPEDLLDAIALEAEQARAEPEPAAAPAPNPAALAEIAARANEAMGDRTIEAPSPWAAAGDSWAPEKIAEPAPAIEDTRAAARESSFDSTMVDQPPQAAAPPADDLLDKPTVGVASSATLDDLFQDDAPPKPRIVAAPRADSLFGDLDDDDGASSVVSSSRGTPAPEPEDEDGPADSRAGDGMLYQRHDNSVLFSLSEIDSDKKDKEPEKKAKALQALTADSGLIDIRSFSKKKKDKKEEKGDLFAAISGEDAAAGAARGAATEAPALAFKPSAAAIPVIQRKKKNGAAIAAFAFGAVAVAAITTLLVMNLNKETPAAPAVAVAPAVKDEPKPADKAPAVAPVAAVTPAPVAPAPAPVEPAVVQPAVPPPAGDPAQPAPVAPTEAQPGAPEQPGAAVAPAEVAKVDAAVEAPKAEVPKAPEVPLTPEQKRAKEKRDKERAEKMKADREKADIARAEKAAADKAKAELAKVEKAEKVEKEKKPNEPSGNDLLKSLGQVKKVEPAKTDANPGGEELPEQLSAMQVKRCVAKAIGRISACVKGAGESVTSVPVRFTVTPSGSITGATASGTSASGCVVGALSSLNCGAAKSPKTVSIPIPIR